MVKRLAISLPPELDQAVRELAAERFAGVTSRAIAYLITTHPVTKSRVAALIAAAPAP